VRVADGGAGGGADEMLVGGVAPAFDGLGQGGDALVEERLGGQAGFQAIGQVIFRLTLDSVSIESGTGVEGRV